MDMLRHAQFHGAVRLADSRHRWCWAALLVFLLLASTAVLSQVLLRFFNSPTILVKLQSEHKTIPFPSVIICPEVEFPQENIDRFLEEIEIPNGIDVERFRKTIQQLAAFYALDVKYNVKHLEDIKNVLDYNLMQMDVAMYKLIKNCSQALIRCIWRAKITDCSKLFKMELTGVGFCCVFNGRSLRREIVQYGLHKAKPKKSLVDQGVGHMSGLSIAIEQTQLHTDVDLSYKWMALQGGQGYVDVSINGTPLSPGTERWFGFSQTRFHLSDQVRGWSNDLLKCRPKDDALKYFPVYHWRYCLLECEMGQTLRRCGCLRANHPKLMGVKPCPPHKLDCSRHNSVGISSSDECNCPQVCEMEIDYTTRMGFELSPHNHVYHRFYDGLDLEKVTIARAYIIMYNDHTFLRRPLQTSLDLFSNLGGIFNVYLGCSVLTILELIVLLQRGIRRYFMPPHPRSDNKMRGTDNEKTKTK